MQLRQAAYLIPMAILMMGGPTLLRACLGGAHNASKTGTYLPYGRLQYITIFILQNIQKPAQVYMNSCFKYLQERLPGDDHIWIRLGEEVKVLEVASGQANHHTRLVLHPCWLRAGVKQNRGRDKLGEGGEGGC